MSVRDAGELGGRRVLYSGAPDGLRKVTDSKTARYLFAERDLPARLRRNPSEWLKLENVTLNNLHQLSVEFPIGLFTSISGVSGSGKSSLVSQALVELVAAELGHEPPAAEESSEDAVDLAATVPGMTSGHITSGMQFIKRMVNVDQKPIGRTPRPTWRPTPACSITCVARLRQHRPRKSRKYDAGRFSFNMPKGRCATCEGRGICQR